MEINTKTEGEVIAISDPVEGVKTLDSRCLNVEIKGITSLQDIEDAMKSVRHLFKTLIPKV
jgi:hypothetical protein